MKRTILTTLVAGFLLSGCSAIEKTTELSKNVEAHFDDITKTAHTPTQPYQNVFHFKKMYVEELSEEESKLPHWYHEKMNYFFKDLPLRDVFDQLARKYTINFEARTGVNLDEKVTLIRRDNPVGNLLDALTAMTGYQFTINGNNVVVNKYITEIFRLEALSGSTNYSIGKTNLRNQNQSGSNNNQVTADLISTTGDEYTTRKGTYDMLQEALKGVEAILGCRDDEGASQSSADNALPEERCDFGANAETINSGSSILVRALPSQIEAVRAFIDGENEIAKRQIRATVTILTVELADSNQFSLDLNIVEKALFNSKNVGLGFASDAASNIIGGLAGADTATLNYKSAGQMTVEALEQQGRILKRDMLRGTSLNNVVSQLTEIDKQSYVSDRPIQQTANVGATTGIEQSVADSGALLYMHPNIGEREVILHLSSSQSSLLALDTKGSGDQEVEAPKIGDKHINTVVKVTPGRPVIIGGTSSTELETKSSRTTSLGPSSARSATKKRTETIILLEVEYLK